MTRQWLFTTALAAGLALAGCNKTPEPPKTETDAAATGDVVTASSNPTVGGAEMLATRNIVENASASPIHKTLVAAVKQAGLVETLSGPGPFTVFAPTNEAFAALPAGLVDKLLKPENKDVLTKILTYHVLSSKVMAADVKDGKVSAYLKKYPADALPGEKEVS